MTHHQVLWFTQKYVDTQKEFEAKKKQLLGLQTPPGAELNQLPGFYCITASFLL